MLELDKKYRVIETGKITTIVEICDCTMNCGRYWNDEGLLYEANELERFVHLKLIQGEKTA